MNATQQPMFRLERKVRMKYHLKSIIIGLSIVLVILLVYIGTLPSVKPEEGNKLRWLQKILDENMKKKIAMKNLYKPKVQEEESSEEDAFWFPETTTSSYSESTTAFYETTAVPTSSQIEKPAVRRLDRNELLLQSYIKKFGLPALKKLLGETSSSTTSTRQLPENKFFKHVKQVIKSFHDDTAGSESASTPTQTSTSTLQSQLSKTKFSDIQKEIIRNIEQGNKYRSKIQDILRSNQAAQVNLNTIDESRNHQERKTVSAGSAKLGSYQYQTKVESPPTQGLDNNKKIENVMTEFQDQPPERMNEKANMKPFSDRPNTLIEPTNPNKNSIGENRPRNQLTKYKEFFSDKSVQEDNKLPKKDSITSLKTRINSGPSGGKTPVADIIINNALIKANTGSNLTHVEDKISTEPDKKNAIQPEKHQDAAKSINKPSRKPVNKPASNGLIQNISVITNSRVKICKMNTSTAILNDYKNCGRLQTITSYMVLCTYPQNKDSGGSSLLRVKHSWEFVMMRDLQLALFGDRSTGFIDIGAGIGANSLAIAKLEHPVIAIEPYMPHVRLLQKSILLNNIKDYITVICSAVSNIHETLIAEPVPGHRTQVRWNNIPVLGIQQKEVDKSDENIVDSIVLDDLLEVVNLTKAVVKIDVPGFDRRILKASYRLFNTIKIPYIFMHWEGRSKADIEDICEFFVGQHYVAIDHYIGNEIDMKTLWHSDFPYVIWKKKETDSDS